MVTFADLDQYWDPALVLTVDGRQYQVPLPTAELGLWCQQVAQLAGAVDAAATDKEMEAAIARIEALPHLPGDLSLPQRTLGDVYQQMIDDGVQWPKIQYCGQTAYVWITAGEQAAARWWTSGGRPEAPGPANRARRRVEAKSARKTSTAAANATKQASTNGTNSRRKSAGSAQAARSRGSRS